MEADKIIHWDIENIIDFFETVRENSEYIQNTKRGESVYRQPFLLKYRTSTIEAYLKSWDGTKKYFDNVKKEFEIFQNSKSENETFIELTAHPFWQKETNRDLILNYIRLFKKLDKDFCKRMESRNNITMTYDTCISLIQINNNCLSVYQRSCDFSLGFLADLKTIYLIAKKYNCTHVFWFHANLHIYTNNFDETIEQFRTRQKKLNLKFNVWEE